MKLKVLGKGLYLYLGEYNSGGGRRRFTATQQDSIMFIPDDWADQGRAEIDKAVADGLCEIVQESRSVSGARRKVLTGTTAGALDFDGELVGSVDLAFTQSGTVLELTTDFTLSAGVITTTGDQTGETLVFFYTPA